MHAARARSSSGSASSYLRTSAISVNQASPLQYSSPLDSVLRPSERCRELPKSFVGPSSVFSFSTEFFMSLREQSASGLACSGFSRNHFCLGGYSPPQVWLVWLELRIC